MGGRNEDKDQDQSAIVMMYVSCEYIRLDTIFYLHCAGIWRPNVHLNEWRDMTTFLLSIYVER